MMKRIKDIFNYNTKGIFNLLNQKDVPWRNVKNAKSLDVNYIGLHSGEKFISPLVEELLEDDTLTEDGLETLVDVIYEINIENWTRLYQALQEEYNALHNYDGTETESITVEEKGTDTNERTGDDTTQNTGTNTNARTGDETTKNTGTNTNAKTGTDSNTKTGSETTQDNGTTNNDTYGFNSSTSVDSDDSTSTNTSTLTYNNVKDETTYNSTDTLTQNTQNKTEYNTTDTLTQNTQNKTEYNTTDTETKDLTTTTTRTLTKGGNLGVTTSQQMLESEFEFRKKYKYFDVVFENLDEILTLKIY